jgi:predicted naringenin-chalcone synthase
LGAQAIQKALKSAGMSKDDVTGLVVNTCTGYLCPGLSSYLVEDLGLSDQTQVRDLAGMGCGGALPNFDTAAGMVQQDPAAVVLSVSIEICTATLYMGASPDLVVSNSIFGDGASAVIIANSERNRLVFKGFKTGIFPAYRKDLQYRTENHRLRNVLSKKVPIVAGEKVRLVLENLLEAAQLTREELSYYVMHPGGTQILDRVQRDLNLSQADLQESHDILREYGNMSSPSVVFVLERLLKNRRPKTGEKAVILAFGAGFSVFASLVEFC